MQSELAALLRVGHSALHVWAPPPCRPTLESSLSIPHSRRPEFSMQARSFRTSTVEPQRSTPERVGASVIHRSGSKTTARHHSLPLAGVLPTSRASFSSLTPSTWTGTAPAAVCTLPAVTPPECTRPLEESVTTCTFIPKTPLIALLRRVHLGIALLLFVVGRGRGRDQRRVDNHAAALVRAASARTAAAA